MADPLFQPGDQVRVISARHRAGAVTGEIKRKQGQFWYPVFFGPGDIGVMPEEDLESYSSERDIHSMMLEGLFGGSEALSRLVTHLKLSLDLRSQVYALSASRTRFYPYQFKPLLKFLDSRNHRLLIADEVGLGKTIEAGLILTELRHRRPDLARVLIVPPAHLRRKWQSEMQRRFGRAFQILDSNGIHEFLRSYERDGPATQLWGIASLQTLRGARVMERWEEVGPELDFVVFDEAGRLRNPETRSHRMASRIAEAADAVILLTATPVQTGARDLFHLLSLLDPESFDREEVFDEQLFANAFILEALSKLRDRRLRGEDIAAALKKVEQSSLWPRFRDNPIYQEVVDRLLDIGDMSRRARIELQRDVESLSIFGHILSRTRKRDAHEKVPERRARAWRPESRTDAEAEFYEEVTRICRDAYARADDRRGASFGIIQPQRQMASCMIAMVDYVEQQLRNAESIEPECVDIEILNGDDEEERSKVVPRWEELGNLDEWRRMLGAHDSKFESLLRALSALDDEEPGAKVILFTFFKRTASYIQGRLSEAGISVLKLTGDTPTDPNDIEKDERHQLIERFRTDPSVRVLVATEVADEGLDLQFAHCMVNYDLPWNPMRIEQRIGRIDRIGQASDTLQIINLSMPDTIEDRILELLYERIGIFERSIGDLESIIGNIMEELQEGLFSSQLTPEEEARAINNAADVIEKTEIESARLEAEAESLIGHDEFFTDEIRRAQGRKRYVTGEELVIFLRDYLKENHKRASLTKNEADNRVWKLRMTDPLLEVVRASAPSGDREMIRFLSRTGSRTEVRFTTEPELADEVPELELLTFYHPLIRTVNSHYDERSEELHPIASVRVSDSELPEGTFAWFLYSTELSGAQPVRDLEVIAVSLADGSLVAEDDCDSLLWAMVADSTSTPESEIEIGVSLDVCHAADDTLAQRLNEKFEKRKRFNEALVANRLASLRETFERNLERGKKRVREAQDRKRKPSYIKGLETQVRNLESGYRTKVAEVEATREMARSFKPRGAGIVKVVHGE